MSQDLNLPPTPATPPPHHHRTHILVPMLIGCALVCAFALGYELPRYHHPASAENTPVAIAPPPDTTQLDNPLLLSTNLPDAEGVVFDPSFHQINAHFKEIAKPVNPSSPKSPQPIELPPLDFLPKIESIAPPMLPELLPILPQKENSPIDIPTLDGPSLVREPKVQTQEPPLAKLEFRGLDPLDDNRLIPVVARETVKPIPCFSTRSVSLSFGEIKQGTSGIKTTELWVRKVGTTEWSLLDRKAGFVEPFATQLPGEGVFEVAVVFESGSGKRSALNQAESQQIEVDLTPPKLKLQGLSAVPADAEHVKITWTAQDKNFDAMPIRLAYSWDGQSWLSVSTQPIANTGEYLWKLPANRRHEVQLKILASDRAGNIAEANLPEKLSVDLFVPLGKIKAVNLSREEDRSNPGIRGILERVTSPEAERLPMPRLAVE